MKKFTLFVILFASIIGARGDSIKAAVICAGAATLNNGSVITIGQPFVGVMSAAGSATITLGIVPELLTNYVGIACTNQPPPVIGSSTFAAGLFRMTLDSSVLGKSYSLDATTNLLNWVPLSTQFGTGLKLILVDPDAASFEYRFYRVREECP